MAGNVLDSQLLTIGKALAGRQANVRGQNGERFAQDSAVVHAMPGEVVLPPLNTLPVELTEMLKSTIRDLNKRVVGHPNTNKNPVSGLDAFAPPTRPADQRGVVRAPMRMQTKSGNEVHLAYITPAEARLLSIADVHNSKPPHPTKFGIPNFDGGGSAGGDAGDDSDGNGGSSGPGGAGSGAAGAGGGSGEAAEALGGPSTGSAGVAGADTGTSSPSGGTDPGVMGVPGGLAGRGMAGFETAAAPLGGAATTEENTGFTVDPVAIGVGLAVTALTGNPIAGAIAGKTAGNLTGSFGEFSMDIGLPGIGDVFSGGTPATEGAAGGGPATDFGGGDIEARDATAQPTTGAPQQQQRDEETKRPELTSSTIDELIAQLLEQSVFQFRPLPSRRAEVHAAQATMGFPSLAEAAGRRRR